MPEKEYLPEENAIAGPDETLSPATEPQPAPGGIRPPNPPQATRLNKLALVVAAGIMSVTLLIVAFMVGDQTEQDAQTQQARRATNGPANATFYDRPPAADEDGVDPFTGLPTNDQTLSDQELAELARATEAYTAQYQPPVYAPEQGRAAHESSGSYYQSGSQQRTSEAQTLDRALRSSLSPQGLSLASSTVPQVAGNQARTNATGAGLNSTEAAYLNTLSELQALSGSSTGTSPLASAAGSMPTAAASGPASIDPTARPQAFLQQAAQSRQGSNYIATSVQEPISPFELREGTLLEAFLMTGIHSDLPGEVVAQVSRNIYDSQTQQTLLIPKGTRLIGTYDNAIALDQSRLLVAWTRMIFPDGRSVNLPGLNSKDLQGANGLTGKVNRHYWRAFGNALMLAVVGGSLSYATSRTRGAGGAYSYPTPGEIAAGSVATELSRVATEILRGNVNRRPTIRIKEGTPFNIFLNGDLALQPYAPQDGFLQRSRTSPQPTHQITRRGY